MNDPIPNSDRAQPEGSVAFAAPLRESLAAEETLLTLPTSDEHTHRDPVSENILSKLEKLSGSLQQLENTAFQSLDGSEIQATESKTFGAIAISEGSASTGPVLEAGLGEFPGSVDPEFSLSIADPQNDLPNIALDPDELATLHSLVERYEQVVQELNQLNGRIESLLEAEGIKACES